MQIQCLGGFREVGKSAALIDASEKIVLDYGLKVEEGGGPIFPKQLDSIILGHAHLDHRLHPDTFVQLSNGEIKKIRDVDSGKSVPAVDFDSSMRLDNIPCIQRGKIHYSGKLLEISTRSHSIRVTPNHQFFIIAGVTYSTKEASELKLGDYIAVANKIEIEGINQKLLNVKDFEIQIGEELMQILGYMCGDGNFYKGSFFCTDKDIKNLEFYGKLVERHLGLKAHI